jgi:hypothetical protein
MIHITVAVMTDRMRTVLPVLALQCWQQWAGHVLINPGGCRPHECFHG